MEDDALIVGRRDVSTALPAVLAELEQALPSGLYRDDALALLREAYGDGAASSLVTGFGRLLARLFAGTELVLIDPQDPLLAQAARALIQRELGDPLAAAGALAKRNAEIRAAGFPLQVEPLAGDTSLFLLDERGRREKLAYDAAGCYLRRTGRRISTEELTTLAQLTPERFVCGVMLRPALPELAVPLRGVGRRRGGDRLPRPVHRRVRLARPAHGAGVPARQRDAAAGQVRTAAR